MSGFSVVRCRKPENNKRSKARLPVVMFFEKDRNAKQGQKELYDGVENMKSHTISAYAMRFLSTVSSVHM